MDSISVSYPSTSTILSHFSSPNRSLFFFRLSKIHRVKTHKLVSKRPRSIHVTVGFRELKSQQPSNDLEEYGDGILEQPSCSVQENQILVSAGHSKVNYIVKQVAYTLFCFAVGLSNVSQIGASRFVAFAAPLASQVSVDSESRMRGITEGNVKHWKKNDHEYSDYTRRLLQTVSQLLRSIKQGRGGNGNIEEVESALKAVKEKKNELQDEIMNGLQKELNELRSEKYALLDSADNVVGEAQKLTRKRRNLVAGKAEEATEFRMEESVRRIQEKYEGIWERVGQVEDAMLRKETMALSVGIRELSFIEDECVNMVQRFKREIRVKEHTDR